MVKNDKLLRIVRPSVLVFLDSVFHFGASEYAERFLKDVIKVFRQYKPFVITNKVGYALLRAHFPELHSHLAFLPAKRFGKPVILAKDAPKTRDYTNVLSRGMLPISVGLASKSVLLGFDGRSPNEDYFWKHNTKNQYVDSMNSTKKTHPAFFRDINYDKYYDTHCTMLKKEIEEFEKHNRTIVSWTKSFIPALGERFESPLLFKDK
jgi:hypothetical protein